MYRFTKEIVLVSEAVEYCEKALKVYPNAKLKVFVGEGHGFSEVGNRKVAEMTLEFVKRNMR